MAPPEESLLPQLEELREILVVDLHEFETIAAVYLLLTSTFGGILRIAETRLRARQ